MRKTPESAEFASTVKLFKEGVRFRPGGGQNTTLAVVAVNARFTKSELGSDSQHSPDGAFAGDIACAHSRRRRRRDSGLVRDLEGDANVWQIVGG
ncbi:MAG: hypothetical protein R3B51_09585 [Thermodesulfobacteriota bacterium]